MELRLELERTVSFATIHEIQVLYPYLILILKGPDPFPQKAILDCPGIEGTIALIQRYKIGYSQIIQRRGFGIALKWLFCVLHLKHTENSKNKNTNY